MATAGLAVASAYVYARVNHAGEPVTVDFLGAVESGGERLARFQIVNPGPGPIEFDGFGLYHPSCEWQSKVAAGGWDSRGAVCEKGARPIRLSPGRPVTVDLATPAALPGAQWRLRFKYRTGWFELRDRLRALDSGGSCAGHCVRDRSAYGPELDPADFLLPSAGGGGAGAGEGLPEVAGRD